MQNSSSTLPLWDNGTTSLWDNDTTSSAWDNATVPGNSTISVCVMCRYRLEPWIKGIRVAFGSLIVLANIVTFFLLYKSRTLQMALRYFLLNVAVVDGMYGFGFLYHSAIVDFPQFIVMNFECKIRYGMLCMVSMVALFTLMAMCVERVIALKFAFSYHRIITRTNLLIGLVIFWAIPIAIVTPTYIMMDSSVGECNFVRFISAESFVVFALVYFTLMVIAVMSQLILLCITKTHIRKILPTLIGDQREKAAFKMNLKATSTTLALAVPFVICATPKVLTYLYLAFNPRERIKVESITMLAVTVYLNVSNSLVNPLVYCWRLSEMRKQIMALFGRQTSSHTSSDQAGVCGSSKEQGHKPGADFDKGHNLDEVDIAKKRNLDAGNFNKEGCSDQQELVVGNGGKDGKDNCEKRKSPEIAGKDTFNPTSQNIDSVKAGCIEGKIKEARKPDQEYDNIDGRNENSPHVENPKSCWRNQMDSLSPAMNKKNMTTQKFDEESDATSYASRELSYTTNVGESSLWGPIL